jgi:2-polyprenyl-3-methyl-5-hydroxy-6-metoxy-1,4-benzoquinol methylase
MRHDKSYLERTLAAASSAPSSQISFGETSIESVRDFWNRRPCNVRHSPRTVGSREYFDEVELRKYFVEPHIPAFAQFERWHGKRVLEIGCGIGTDTMNFARAGASVTAVDLSEESLEIARRRATAYGLSNISFHCGNAEELSEFLAIEPYDLVYSFGVIHHTPHPERVIAQVRKYARPGTILKIMLYHRRSWKAFEILLREAHGQFWKFSKLLARHSEAQIDSPVTYSYSKREARQLLQSFVVDDMAIEHIFPYRVPDYVQYRYVKVWYLRNLPLTLFHWLERCFGWHLCISAHLPATSSERNGNQC